MLSVLLLAASIMLIVLLTTRLKLHPVAALLLASFFFGTLDGMPLTQIVSAVNDGFGQTLGSIGIVIVAGTIIGTFLHHSGGAGRLASRFVRLAGPRRVPVAMGGVGYVVSMPVFCDSGFVLLSPINKALARRAGVSLATCTVALSLGLYATHTMVPPTPGPVAAAGIVGADLGIVIAFGAVVSIVALAAGLFFAYRYASRIQLEHETTGAPDEGDDPEEADGPSALHATIPIVLPMLLILGRTVAELPAAPFGQGTLAETLRFFGEPTVALCIGVAVALTLPRKLSRRMLSTSGWFGEAVKSAAVILVITGTGGAFGRVLQESGIASDIGVDAVPNAAGVLVPFLVAAAIKTAQGSSTVAMITTAGMILPLLEPLGLDGEIAKALVVVAIGAGSMVVSHANDSYFWVVTQFSGMSVNQGYRLQTLGSLIQGVTAAIVVWLLSVILL